MRASLLYIFATLILSLGFSLQARAQTGFISSDPSGSITCDSSGNCGSITFTPASDGYSYIFQNYCLSTTPVSPVSPTVINGDAGGPCASYTGFNSTMIGASCVENWGGSCTLNISSGGLPAGTYTVYTYIYYTYCPSTEVVSGACTSTATGSTAAGLPATETFTLSGTVASSGGTTTTYSWITGPWSTCSGGTQTRSVTCESSSGLVASSTSDCAGTEPATTQSCTVSSTDPTCTSASCEAINQGPGVTLPNCTPDPSKGIFCIVVPAN